jgi:hypothetical protein
VEDPPGPTEKRCRNESGRIMPRSKSSSPARTKATRGTVFRDVACDRIDDATSLINAERYNGAIYLAGYAIECQLKYAYCDRKEETYLPVQYETHSWDILVEAAGLSPDLKTESKMFDLFSALAEQWGPELRYRTKSYGAGKALQLYNELQELYQFLRELTP